MQRDAGQPMGAIFSGHAIAGLSLTAMMMQFDIKPPSHSQEAVANILQQAEHPYNEFPSYYAWLTNEYSRKRILLAGSICLNININDSE